VPERSMTVSKELPLTKELHRKQIEPANPLRGPKEAFCMTGFLVAQLQDEVASQQEIDGLDSSGYRPRPKARCRPGFL